MEQPTESSTPEVDDALISAYGETAVFSRVGAFTLVHLDSPSPDTIARRVAEFNPDVFFFDGCPLCEASRKDGGHIVYDCDDTRDPLRATSYGIDVTDPEQISLSPAASFDLALMDLASEAEVFEEALRAKADASLLERYERDVDELHDRIIEILWSEEAAERIERFDENVGRAHETVTAITNVHPDLDDSASPLRRALDALAAVWRAL